MSVSNHLNFFHAKLATLCWALTMYNINISLGVREVDKSKDFNIFRYSVLNLQGKLDS